MQAVSPYDPTERLTESIHESSTYVFTWSPGRDGQYVLYVFCCAGNWCDHWFEYFPNPPLNILAMVENVLAYHDHKLLEHFVQYGITSQVS